MDTVKTILGTKVFPLCFFGKREMAALTGSCEGFSLLFSKSLDAVLFDEPTKISL